MTPEDEDNTFIHNVANHSPNDIVSYSRRYRSFGTRLWEPYTSHSSSIFGRGSCGRVFWMKPCTYGFYKTQLLYKLNIYKTRSLPQRNWHSNSNVS
jgi:hypothetical protein